MNTTDLWTALLSDDPDELDGALAAVASDEVSAEIARRDVFAAGQADDIAARLRATATRAGEDHAEARRLLANDIERSPEATEGAARTRPTS